MKFSNFKADSLKTLNKFSNITSSHSDEKTSSSFSELAVNAAKEALATRLSQHIDQVDLEKL